ncbi:cytochrome c biogenesis CcdA family protein [uncultured Methanobrevibacter sp.]|uniref:cytochrome c biogenesis CcdA family protein n=1 Tax=uncultured Methanobrevibacter sp. TaxID=253161 RepID=UPI0025CDACEB|nr:cytochrome c biogenesis CcdA family protein [uncultured Methanobrevibacter sp.]
MEVLPLISFTTGVISILSPCILPILPIFVSVSLKSKSKRELFSFIGGLLTIFIVIIFLTGFFTSILYAYITPIRIISAFILLIIGILMLFDYQFTFKTINPNKNTSSYMMGVLTSVAWAPCYSGYLISLITLLISSNDPAYAVLNIIIYSLGFALTLLVLSYFISRINLERLISRTKYVPKIFAGLVIMGALYLLFESLKAIL